jgi:hypothetical protein
VTVIYSGGGKNEKHRADRRIEEMLNWRQYTGKSAPVFVVTADNGLGQEAKESEAEVTLLDHFEWLLAGGKLMCGFSAYVNGSLLTDLVLKNNVRPV